MRDIVDLIRRLYDHSCVGGNLHCHIDDGNIDLFDEDFRPFIPDVSREQLALETEIHRCMKAMTMEQRQAVIDSYFNFHG